MLGDGVRVVRRLVEECVSSWCAACCVLCCGDVRLRCPLMIVLLHQLLTLTE